MNTAQSTLQQRLINAIALNPALSQAGLAIHCKVTDGAISQWFTGRSKSLRGGNAAKAAQYLGVDSEWLARGPGATPVLATKDACEIAPYVLVDWFSSEDVGGKTTGVQCTAVPAALAFPREWIDDLKVKAQQLRVFRHTGESMAPFIGDGDTVLVDLSETTPQHNQIWLLRRDGDKELRIRRFIGREADGFVIRSDNSDKSRFNDIAIEERQSSTITFVGRIVWRGGWHSESKN
jgi:hypothetical protein